MVANSPNLQQLSLVDTRLAAHWASTNNLPPLKDEFWKVLPRVLPFPFSISQPLALVVCAFQVVLSLKDLSALNGKAMTNAMRFQAYLRHGQSKKLKSIVPLSLWHNALNLVPAIQVIVVCLVQRRFGSYGMTCRQCITLMVRRSLH